MKILWLALLCLLSDLLWIRCNKKWSVYFVVNAYMYSTLFDHVKSASKEAQTIPND